MNPGPSPASGKAETSTRRRLLRMSGVVGLFLLSGCTEDVGEELPKNTKWPSAALKPELPVTERTDVLEERIEALADAEITDEDEFGATFDDYALEVEAVEREQNVLSIEYVNAKQYSEGNLHDIAPIAGAFAALLDSGYDVLGLGITVLDGAPASFGSASIEAEWAEAYNDGGLSAKEYGELVATTVESTRRPPEVGVSPRE
ncbi:hypothetical protein [Natronorubrum halophilum]|uniref:hypothetical protein n=1 Tax=Natronorubrum halophilum TaxID=1702106 RepID=UPI000EF69168|nr:hypothetical protein [Natronorubrum halophilum]